MSENNCRKTIKNLLQFAWHGVCFLLVFLELFALVSTSSTAGVDLYKSMMRSFKGVRKKEREEANCKSMMHSHQLKHTHACTSSDSSCTCFDKSSFICRSRVVCNISLFSDEIQTRSLLLHRDVDRESVPNNTLTPADLSKAPLCFLIVFVVSLLTMHASFWNCDCCSGGSC